MSQNSIESFFPCVPIYHPYLYSLLDRSSQDNQGNNHFGDAPRDIGHLIPGPTQAAFPGPSAHRAPPHGQQHATENLRQLASRCVHHPDSQVDMVRVEPGTVASGGFKVVIVLEMTGFP